MGYSVQRELQRPANATREHHQDRQRASATDRHRSGLELSAAARRRTGVAQASGRRAGGDQRDRLESATPAAQALHAAGGRQGPTQNHYRGGTRTAGLHLGHRDQGGGCQQAEVGGLTKSKNKNKGQNFLKHEKAKNKRMNNTAQFQNKASSSRSQHEGDGMNSTAGI